MSKYISNQTKNKGSIDQNLKQCNLSNTNLTNKSEMDIHYNSNKRVLSSKTKKIEIECDNDKWKDLDYLNQLTPIEKEFYTKNARAIYNFLSGINWIRFIESWINDGFETEEDLWEIQESYFEENKNFSPAQQKRILERVKKLKTYHNNNRAKNNNNVIQENLNNTDTASECDIISTKANKIIRCWTCFNFIKGINYYEKDYNDSIIQKKLVFCSLKCQETFEKRIYGKCKLCGTVFDKSKGDYVYDIFHFDNENCFNTYLRKIKEKDNEKKVTPNTSINMDINSYNYSLSSYTENEGSYGKDVYDPMEDF